MFILASRSPQRKHILEDLDVEFEVIPSNFDEASIDETDPEKRALILAEKKAMSVVGKLDGLPAEASAKRSEGWVIGVDTLVVSQDGELMEKPVDEDDARRMMQLHSGRTSVIHTAICLIRCHAERRRSMSSSLDSARDDTHKDLSTAHVTFRKLSEDDIQWWLELGLWKDRSGAFQIENEGQELITRLEGEFETVVGFPVELFQHFLKNQEP